MCGWGSGSAPWGGDDAVQPQSLILTDPAHHRHPAGLPGSREEVSCNLWCWWTPSTLPLPLTAPLAAATATQGSAATGPTVGRPATPPTTQPPVRRKGNPTPPRETGWNQSHPHRPAPTCKHRGSLALCPLTLCLSVILPTGPLSPSLSLCHSAHLPSVTLPVTCVGLCLSSWVCSSVRMRCLVVR